jgi:hypothetical protein
LKFPVFFPLLFTTLITESYAGEVPTIKLSGKMDVIGGMLKESGPFKAIDPANPDTSDEIHNYALVNDTNIDFNIDGKTNNGLKYGGFARLHADVGTSTSKENTLGDKVLVYIQNDKIGRLEAGSTPGGPGIFEEEISNFGIGSWGIGGFVPTWFSDRTMQTAKAFNSDTNRVPAMVNGNPMMATLKQANGNAVPETRGLEFITYPDLPSHYSGKYYSDANKVNFYTKPTPDLTVAVTYIPDLDTIGTVSNIALNGGPVDDRKKYYPGTFRDIFGAGFVYEKALNKDWKVKAVLAGETGKAKLQGINNLKAYEAGFRISYKEYKFGASYGDWFNSLALKQKQLNSRQGASYWTVGFSQQIEKFGYSVTYLNSKKAGGIEGLTKRDGISQAIAANFLASSIFSDLAFNKFYNVVLDIDYKAAPGLLPYATLSKFRFKESRGYKDNGYIVLVGTRLSF